MIPCSKLRSVILLSVFLSLAFMSVVAQDTPDNDIPYLIFVDEEDHPMLLNILTGDYAALPTEFREYEFMRWSPNGRYLLKLAPSSTPERGTCVKIYDLAQQQWTTDQTITCGVGDATFDPTSSSIVYSDLQKLTIVIKNMFTGEENILYQHTLSEGNFDQVSFEGWSPDGRYLTYTIATHITGGPLNRLQVLNIETQEGFTITPSNLYLATYNPIWRDDSVWFLLKLQDEYVVFTSVLRTNHRGDVYLVNAADGSIKRLTYTPAEFEHDLGWDKNGNIQYTVIQTITLEEALAIPDVSDDQIIKPEPIPFFAMFSRVAVESPDHQLVALTDPDFNSEGDNVWSNISISCINSSRFISEIRIDSKVDRILWSPNSDKVLGYLCDQ